MDDTSNKSPENQFLQQIDNIIFSANENADPGALTELSELLPELRIKPARIITSLTTRLASLSKSNCTVFLQVIDALVKNCGPPMQCAVCHPRFLAALKAKWDEFKNTSVSAIIAELIQNWVMTFGRRVHENYKPLLDFYDALKRCEYSFPAYDAKTQAYHYKASRCKKCYKYVNEIKSGKFCSYCHNLYCGRGCCHEKKFHDEIILYCERCSSTNDEYTNVGLLKKIIGNKPRREDYIITNPPLPTEELFGAVSQTKNTCDNIKPPPLDVEADEDIRQAIAESLKYECNSSTNWQPLKPNKVKPIKHKKFRTKKNETQERSYQENEDQSPEIQRHVSPSAPSEVENHVSRFQVEKVMRSSELQTRLDYVLKEASDYALLLNNNLEVFEGRINRMFKSKRLISDNTSYTHYVALRQEAGILATHINELQTQQQILEHLLEDIYRIRTTREAVDQIRNEEESRIRAENEARKKEISQIVNQTAAELRRQRQTTILTQPRVVAALPDSLTSPLGGSQIDMNYWNYSTGCEFQVPPDPLPVTKAVQPEAAFLNNPTNQRSPQPTIFNTNTGFGTTYPLASQPTESASIVQVEAQYVNPIPETFSRPEPSPSDNSAQTILNEGGQNASYDATTAPAQPKPHETIDPHLLITTASCEPVQISRLSPNSDEESQQLIRFTDDL